MNNYTVYTHTNKTNGMVYVGITSQKPETRWLSGYGYYKQEHFWRAIKKYGWDGFEHKIIASGLSAEDAYRLESDLIVKYRSNDKRYGYNKSTGGEAGAKGVVKNANQRAAASRSLKKKWKDPAFRAKVAKNLEKAQTKEAREKVANALRGRKHSEELRKRMGEARKGIKPPPFTEEHRKRISEHHAGGAEKKPVICVESGQIYESINDAARASGVTKKMISNCCRRVAHYNTAGGYHWNFA